MHSGTLFLATTAAIIAFTHTVLGPDHYLPFVMMARAGKWSRAKTHAVAALCGVGHVGGSVAIGSLGIVMGIGVGRLEALEAVRGQFAAWALIAVGLAYGTWGVHRALGNRPHVHRHPHAEGTAHEHEHTHTDTHAHAHTAGRGRVTPWVLFVVFVLGPCEPLIPVLMYPASQHSGWGVVVVVTVFGAVTIATMLAVVELMLRGVSFVRVAPLERYAHAVAGFTIAGSGIAVRFLGL